MKEGLRETVAIGVIGLVVILCVEEGIGRVCKGGEFVCWM